MCCQGELPDSSPHVRDVSSRRAAARLRPCGGRAYPTATKGGGAGMSLTLSQATTIVESALKKGRELNLAPLTVAVLDAGGHLKALAREDGSGIVRPQIAVGKAWGALGMGIGSRTLAKRVTEQGPQQQ